MHGWFSLLPAPFSLRDLPLHALLRSIVLFAASAPRSAPPDFWPAPLTCSVSNAVMQMPLITPKKCKLFVKFWMVKMPMTLYFLIVTTTVNNYLLCVCRQVVLLHRLVKLLFISLSVNWWSSTATATS